MTGGFCVSSLGFDEDCAHKHMGLVCVAGAIITAACYQGHPGQSFVLHQCVDVSRSYLQHTAHFVIKLCA